MSGYAFIQLATNQFVARNPQKAHLLHQHNRFEHIFHLTRIVGNGSPLTPVVPLVSACVPATGCKGTCCPNGYGLWNCTCKTNKYFCTKDNTGEYTCTFI